LPRTHNPKNAKQTQFEMTTKQPKLLLEKEICQFRPPTNPKKQTQFAFTIYVTSSSTFVTSSATLVTSSAAERSINQNADNVGLNPLKAAVKKMQNKPNFKNYKMNLTSYKQRDY
jgi:hypothetical protein